jgi:hypothetical protein
MPPMADHPHTIDRWDDATGENLMEQIAAVGVTWSPWRLTGRGGEALAEGQDHAAQPGADHRAKLAGVSSLERAQPDDGDYYPRSHERA